VVGGVLLLISLPGAARSSRLRHHPVDERGRSQPGVGAATAEYEATKDAQHEARRQAIINRLTEPAPEPDIAQQQRLQLRTAALLLRTELLDIRHKIENFRKDPTVPDGFAFPAFEWEKHRELIAQDPVLYVVVEQAYTTAHRVNEILAWRRTVSTSRLIGINDADGLAGVDAAASAAVAALDDLVNQQMGDVPRKSHHA